MNKETRPKTLTFEEAKAVYPAWIDVFVRYTDIDGNNHVNSSVFVTYMEIGRSSLRSLIGLSRRYVGVVARIEVDYIGEVTYPNTVQVGTAIERLGNSSITISQVIYVDGRLAARAKSVSIYIDNENKGAKLVFDDAHRAAFAPAMMLQA